MYELLSQDKYTVEVPLSSIVSPDLLAGLDLWRSWCDGRAAPCWADIRLQHLPSPLLPMVAVVDVLDDGRDFKYRFWGTGLAQLFGREETGRLLSEHQMPASFETRSFQLASVVERQTPLFFVTSFEHSNRLHATKLNLRLPVMDAENAVTKILSMSLVERHALAGHEDLSSYWSGID